jgi:hypothetical protein
MARKKTLKQEINLGSVLQRPSLDLALTVLAAVLHAWVHQDLAKWGVLEKDCQLVGM